MQRDYENIDDYDYHMRNRDYQNIEDYYANLRGSSGSSGRRSSPVAPRTPFNPLSPSNFVTPIHRRLPRTPSTRYTSPFRRAPFGSYGNIGEYYANRGGLYNTPSRISYRRSNSQGAPRRRTRRTSMPFMKYKQLFPGPGIYENIGDYYANRGGLYDPPSPISQRRSLPHRSSRARTRRPSTPPMKYPFEPSPMGTYPSMGGYYGHLGGLYSSPIRISHRRSLSYGFPQARARRLSTPPMRYPFQGSPRGIYPSMGGYYGHLGGLYNSPNRISHRRSFPYGSSRARARRLSTPPMRYPFQRSPRGIYPSMGGYYGHLGGLYNSPRQISRRHSLPYSSYSPARRPYASAPFVNYNTPSSAGSSPYRSIHSPTSYNKSSDLRSDILEISYDDDDDVVFSSRGGIGDYGTRRPRPLPLPSYIEPSQLSPGVPSYARRVRRRLFSPFAGSPARASARLPSRQLSPSPLRLPPLPIEQPTSFARSLRNFFNMN